MKKKYKMIHPAGVTHRRQQAPRVRALENMKITEAYRSRAAVEAACKSADACSCEYKALLSATTAVEWENVLLRNFSWCVKNCIMEEWLPAALPAYVELYCYGCTGLTALPAELPTCVTLNCGGCTGLTDYLRNTRLFLTTKSINKMVYKTSLNFGKEELICHITIPPYRPATHLQPEEGGINDYEVDRVFYKDIDVTDLLMEICPDIIFEKIKAEIKNEQ